MSDLPQLHDELVAAARRRARRRGPHLPRAGWSVLPKLAAGAALLTLVVVMVLPRERDERSSTGRSTTSSLERLASIVPAFSRPAREGDLPRWPGSQQGTWRLLGRREGRRGWLGLVPAGSDGPERLCLVTDLRPYAEEGVDCRPARERLDGRQVLGAVTHERAGRFRLALAAVPPRSELVVFTRTRGSPVAATPTPDGLVARADAGGITGLQLRGPDGGAVTERFGFRQPRVPGGLVDTYAVWRRVQTAGDRRPAVAPRTGRLSTWRAVGGGRGVEQFLYWTGRSLCSYVLPAGRRLGLGSCVVQGDAYGGVLTRDTARGLLLLLAPDRVASVDVVRAGGSADRYAVVDNGVALPARPGDRAVRLLDADGILLQERRP